jgi:hypothetical protein
VAVKVLYQDEVEESEMPTKILTQANSRGALQKGQWCHQFDDRSVLVRCPGCGQIATLDHDVADDGTVTPSLVCPVEGCNFHEFVRLDGWVTK